MNPYMNSDVSLRLTPKICHKTRHVRCIVGGGAPGASNPLTFLSEQLHPAEAAVHKSVLHE